ncbi:hypothetical protein CSC12_1688 [Klebsiella michiganensis]|nr:hypothetical protein CSC12_1688 [Klebsiella michiganensis]
MANTSMPCICRLVKEKLPVIKQEFDMGYIQVLLKTSYEN